MRRLTRAISLVLGLLVLSSAVTVVLTVVGTVVETRDDLDPVGFGLPLPWLMQDQGRLEPSLPSRQHPGLPQEYPSSVSFGLLGVDLAVVALAVVALAGLVVLVVNARRQRDAGAR